MSNFIAVLVAKSKLSDYDYRVLINKNTIETIEYIGENIFRIVTNKLDFNCKFLENTFEEIFMDWTNEKPAISSEPNINLAELKGLYNKWTWKSMRLYRD